MSNGRTKIGPGGRELQELARGSLTVGYQTAIMEAMSCVDDVLTEQGITRKELATRMGIDPSRVSRLLNEPDNITVRTFYRLCRAVGLEPTICADRGPRLMETNDWMLAEAAAPAHAEEVGETHDGPSALAA